MDLISFVTPSSASTTASSQSSTVGLADNFDTFLRLLTSQLQNQDPLEPTDATDFTNQLVQFSQVEQQIRTNTQLDTLILGEQKTAGAALAAYLGQEVEIGLDSAGFHGDPVPFTYDLPYNGVSATALIHDAQGQIVWSAETDASAGRHDFSWDGRLLDGGTASEGAYRFSVVAEDETGQNITAQLGVKTVVTGLDLSGENSAIRTSAGIYEYADIIRVSNLAT